MRGGERWISTAGLFLIFLVWGWASWGCASSSVSRGITADHSFSPGGIKETRQSRFVQEHATEEIAWDLVHLDLTISPDFSTECIEGRAVWLLTPYAYPQDSLFLDAVQFSVETLIVAPPYTNRLQEWKVSEKGIHIRWAPALTPRDTLRLEIHYEVCLPSTDEEGEAVAGDRGLYFINASGRDPWIPPHLWTQGETEWNSRWFPLIDEPNQKYTQKVCLHVPDPEWVSLSNGTLVYSYYEPDGTRVDCWEQRHPHSAYLTFVAMGPYVVVEDTPWRGKPVQYYCFKEVAPYARQIFPRTRAMLEYFSQLFQYPYPWDKYAQIMVYGFEAGAMENTTSVLFSSVAVARPSDLRTRPLERIVAHELVHHWFGNVVTCEEWAHIPLNESFADYGELLWLEHQYGTIRADFARQCSWNGYLNSVERNPESAHPLIYYGYESPEEMFDAHSYNKGGVILHYLRWILGDSAFFEGLRQYLYQREFQPAEAEHLRLALEDASGKDLRWFFEDWFYTAGHPVLEIYWGIPQQLPHDTGWSVPLVLRQTSFPVPGYVYFLPFAVKIRCADGTEYWFRRTLASSEDTFFFHVSCFPEYGLWDPDRVVPAKIDTLVYPPQWLASVLQYEKGLIASLVLEWALCCQDPLPISEKELISQILLEEDTLTLSAYLGLLNIARNRQRISEKTLLDPEFASRWELLLREGTPLLQRRILHLLPDTFFHSRLSILSTLADSSPYPLVRYASAIQYFRITRDTVWLFRWTRRWISRDTSRTTWSRVLIVYASFLPPESLPPEKRDSLYMWLVEAFWRFAYDHYLFLWIPVYLNFVVEASDQSIQNLLLDTFITWWKVRPHPWNRRAFQFWWWMQIQEEDVATPGIRQICQRLHQAGISIAGTCLLEEEKRKQKTDTSVRARSREDSGKTRRRKKQVSPVLTRFPPGYLPCR